MRIPRATVTGTADASSPIPRAMKRAGKAVTLHALPGSPARTWPVMHQVSPRAMKTPACAHLLRNVAGNADGIEEVGSKCARPPDGVAIATSTLRSCCAPSGKPDPMRNGDPVSATIVSRYSTNDALTGRRTRLLYPGSERAAGSTLQSVALKRCRERSSRPHTRCPPYPEPLPSGSPKGCRPPAACPPRPGG